MKQMNPGPALLKEPYPPHGSSLMQLLGLTFDRIFGQTNTIMTQQLHHRNWIIKKKNPKTKVFWSVRMLNPFSPSWFNWKYSNMIKIAVNFRLSSWKYPVCCRRFPTFTAMNSLTDWCTENKLFWCSEVKAKLVSLFYCAVWIIIYESSSQNMAPFQDPWSPLNKNAKCEQKCFLNCFGKTDEMVKSTTLDPCLNYLFVPSCWLT